MNLDGMQQALREAGIDAWLFYDHHHRDPIAERILGLDPEAHVTRRWYYAVPATGAPRKLVHRIESGRLDTLPGSRVLYSSWQELEAGLAAMLAGTQTVAMQYSPRNAIMYVSMVDAGTVELVRALGKTPVSSANLVSHFEAVLTAAQIETHFIAQQRLDEILAAGWRQIGERVRGAGHTDEYAIATFLREGIARAGMITEYGPNVSCGPNSADSHYGPTPERTRRIATGDFLLIDIWAKLAGNPDAVWYDITWTGVVGREPTEREQMVFTTVRDARDAAIRIVEEAFAAGRPIAGWQADEAARTIIRNAGLAAYFTHRTGHNIASALHGNGAHLDNLETHDERLLLPATCFSVEPGLYFPGEFGVRNEVNMVARSGHAAVSGPRQNELLRI